MAFHQVSGSRNDRFSELTQQARLIEEKKREIERKLQLKKENETPPATVTSTKPSLSTSKLQSLGLGTNSSKAISPVSSIKKESIKEEYNEDDCSSSSSTSTNNAFKFKNDGSFLEQFKRMQAAKTSASLPSVKNTITTSKPGVVIKLQAPSQKSIITHNETVKAILSAEDENQDNQNKKDKMVSPPDDQGIRWACEKTAISVAINGATAEEAARRENQDNPSYSFLNDVDGSVYKYFKERVGNLKDAKQRAQDDGILTSMLTTSTNRNRGNDTGATTSSTDEPQPKRKRKSRWGPQEGETSNPNPLPTFVEKDPALVTYALQVFGSSDLTFEQWKQLDDQRKMKVLFQMMQAKQQAAEAFARAGKVKYEYDSDEDVDDKGTWEHKKRMVEMEKTKEWAEELTEKAKGKHHIGDFLPPEELEKFMEKWEALKEGRPADLSDYKEHKISSDNVGYQMLQKLGWAEGQGLGSNGAGITTPVNKGAVPVENAGLGQNRPDDVSNGDDEYEAYRKRMMLAYRFRPNPLNNPRRAYY